jgi:hypothetical protein
MYNIFVRGILNNFFSYKYLIYVSWHIVISVFFQSIFEKILFFKSVNKNNFAKILENFPKIPISQEWKIEPEFIYIENILFTTSNF